MRRTLAALAPAIVISAALAGGNVACAAELRVASLSLCADQVLMELLPATQIVGLSPDSRQASMSYHADLARNLPVHDLQVETIIADRPTVIFSAAYAAKSTTQLLEKLGYHVVYTRDPELLADVPAFVRHIAAHLDAAAQEKAESLIANYQQELAALQEKVANLPPATVALYSPNGLTVGGPTLEDDLMRYAGLTNLAREAGLTTHQHISLETLVSWQPDYLWLDNITFNMDSLSHAYLSHPVLKKLVGERGTLTVDGPLRACPGLMSVKAAAQLADQR